MRNKNPTYDQSFAVLEKNVVNLKELRTKYENNQIPENEYENLCESLFESLEEAFQSVRHSYLPLSIPNNLKLPEIPYWMNVSKRAKDGIMTISQESDLMQENLLRKFRRPGMRKANIEKAANLLSYEQSKLANSELWKAYNVLSDDIIDQIRLRVVPLQKVPTHIIKEINEYIAENEIDLPTSKDMLDVLLVQLFGEEGPLESGIPSKSLEDEIAIISGAIAAVSPDIDRSRIVDYLLPHIADLHMENITGDSSIVPKEVLRCFRDLVSNSDEPIKLEDFGYEGDIPMAILEATASITLFETVNEIVTNFQELGKAVVRVAKNYHHASSMLAVALVTQQSLEVPSLFFIGLRWASLDAVNKFTLAPLFLMAFGKIVEMVPNLDE